MKIMRNNLLASYLQIYFKKKSSIQHYNTIFLGLFAIFICNIHILILRLTSMTVDCLQSVYRWPPSLETQGQREVGQGRGSYQHEAHLDDEEAAIIRAVF